MSCKIFTKNMLFVRRFLVTSAGLEEKRPGQGNCLPTASPFTVKILSSKEYLMLKVGKPKRFFIHTPNPVSDHEKGSLIKWFRGPWPLRLQVRLYSILKRSLETSF